MAGRIKGLTVEIGGDVTGLDKALKTVNKTIKDTQSQLKDVEKLLKLDPGNTELLAQKQRLLGEAISGTKEKLETLKTAEEQARKQMENGELGRDKYEALQREIIATENELDELAQKAGEANAALIKMDQAGKTIEQIGDNITNVGTNLSTHVTAPIVAVGAASMAAFSEVDSAIDGMISKTGAAGTELDKMQTAVENIATSVPTDFETAANAVGEVSTRFSDVGGQLEKLSGKFVQFATLNNIDVVTAVDNVQASMAAFGEPTSRAGIVLDTLNGIAQQTGTDVNTLTTMLTQNAGVMKEMGFEYEDAAYFMANLNKNGVDVSSTMTGLKKAWQTASKEGKSMKTVLSEMNNTIKNAKTNQEAYRKAIDLFGAKAGPAIAEAVRSGRLSLEDLNVLMSDYAGNVENTFDATLDPIDQTTMAMNELKLIGADLAGVAQDMLMPALEMLREKIHQLREWWNNLDESQQQNIIKFAAVAAAIGPLLVIFGNLTSGVGKGIQAFAQIGTKIATLVAQTQAGTGPLMAFKAAIAGISAPVLAVVAAIGVLVAAFLNLWHNNEEFRNNITAIWEEIKGKFEEFGASIKKRLDELGIDFSGVTETLTTVWNGFCELLAPVFTGAFDIISTALGTALDVLTGLLDVFIGVFTGDWEQAWSGVEQIASSIWEGIKGIVSGALDIIKGVVDVFLGWFGTDWETVWNTAKETVSGIWDAIQLKAQEIVEAIKLKWEELTTNTAEKFETIKTDALAKWEEIKTNVINKVTELRTQAEQKVVAMVNAVKLKWNGLQTSAESTFETIKTNVLAKWESLKSEAVTKAEAMKSEIHGKFNSIKQDAISIWESVKTEITGKIEAAKDKVEEVIDAIKGFFDFQFEIPHIPLPHFAISPPGWTWEDLLKGVIPSLGIDWYAKAMKNGMILNSPTIFGMKDGQLLGAGEAGSEAVVGTQSLMKMIQSAVDSANKTTYGDMTVNVVSYGTNATEIADEIGLELNRKLRMAGGLR